MKKYRMLTCAALTAAMLSAASCSGDGDNQKNNPEENSAEATQQADGEESAETADLNATTPDKEKTSAQYTADNGYKTTDSGLKYKVIKKGSGARPTASSVVTVKYTGKLENGMVFDSTDLHGGEPATFPLDGVIPGWTEGLQLMQPGAVYEFVIPGNLAYGPQGIPGTIPPNATLIFDVELISFN